MMMFLGFCMEQACVGSPSIGMPCIVFYRNLWRRKIVLLPAHSKLGEGEVALQLYDQVQSLGGNPEKVLFLSALTACSSSRSVCHGALIHSQIAESGIEVDAVVANALVDMYSKCSNLEEAQVVFDCMENRDVISWNSLIGGYVQCELGCNVLKLFDRMRGEGVNPCEITYLGALKACSFLGLVEKGRMIHDEIVVYGLLTDVTVGNTLIGMYCKCKCLEEAHYVFGSLQCRSIVSWGAIIAGYADNGYGFQAFQLFKDFLQIGFKPNRVILSSMLKACCSLLALDEGMLIHEQLIKMEHKYDVIIGNILIDMYVKCRSFEDAQSVFDSLPDKDRISWNSIISGYAQDGYVLFALDSFLQMQESGFEPCESLMLCLLKFCAAAGSIVPGMMIHAQVIEKGLETNIMLENTLVNMYSKLGTVVDAHRVFKNLEGETLVSWGAMMTGYFSHGHTSLVLDLYVQMLHVERTPNEVVFVTTLKACTNIRDAVLGGILHDHVVQGGLEANIVVSNAIIDMYAKCGYLMEGRKAFDCLSHRDEVSWGTMLDGYVQNEESFHALKLFIQMQEESVHPNNVVLMLVLRACSDTGAVECGKLIHHQVIENGVELEEGMGTTLIDMYSSCWRMPEARKILVSLPEKDVASWNALIAGYSQHANCESALQCFQDMQLQGCKPDSYTFTSLLAAFSHLGKAEKGYQYFELIKCGYGLVPATEHISCMVDLLARVGYLTEAAGFIKAMPISSNSAAWLSLLTACKTFGSADMGRRCFGKSVWLNCKLELVQPG